MQDQNKYRYNIYNKILRNSIQLLDKQQLKQVRNM